MKFNFLTPSTTWTLFNHIHCHPWLTIPNPNRLCVDIREEFSQKNFLYQMASEKLFNFFSHAQLRFSNSFSSLYRPLIPNNPSHPSFLRKMKILFTKIYITDPTLIEFLVWRLFFRCAGRENFHAYGKDGKEKLRKIMAYENELYLNSAAETCSELFFIFSHINAMLTKMNKQKKRDREGRVRGALNQHLYLFISIIFL